MSSGDSDSGGGWDSDSGGSFDGGAQDEDHAPDDPWVRFNDIDGQLPVPEGAGEFGVCVRIDPTERLSERNFYTGKSRREDWNERHGIVARSWNLEPPSDDDLVNCPSEIDNEPEVAFISSSAAQGIRLTIGGANSASGATTTQASTSETSRAHRLQALERKAEQEAPRTITHVAISYGTMPPCPVAEPEDTTPPSWLTCFYHCILPDRFSPKQYYQSLPRPSCTRLIVIHPGRRGPLTLTMETQDLDKTHFPYEAVSYRWGSVKPHLISKPARLSGHLVYLNITVWCTLLYLRLVNQSRRVWVDALCINQGDHVERTAQVSLMQRIYSQAARVVIRLEQDRSRHDVRESFALVKKLTTSWITFQREGSGTSQQSREWYMAKDNTDNLILSRLEMSKIADVFRDMYWTRLWVLQEVVSARLAVVQESWETIPWTLVGLAATLIRNNPRLWNLFSGVYKPGKPITGLMNAYLMYRLPASEFQDNRLSLLDLLRLTRNFKVTVQLDRIYAILGLPSNHTGPGRKSIAPDYRLRMESLYVRVFHWVITTHETPLDILSGVKHDSLWYPTFPTWIPQWHVQPIRSITGSHHKGMKFNASAGGPTNPLLHVVWNLPERCLRLEGFVLSTVSTSQRVLRDFSLSGRRERWRAHDRELAAWMGQWVGADGSRLSALSLALTAGQDWYGTLVRDAEALVKHEEAFVGYAGKAWNIPKKTWNIPTILGQPTGLVEDTDLYAQAMRNVCRGRKLFATEKGGIGLGPSILKTGDIVCVLLGGSVPYILRRLNRSEHYFLGECYFDSYMFGRAIEDWQAGTLQLREFCLK